MAAIDRGRVMRLRAAGLTVREIARAIGCSHGRVQQVIAESPPLERAPYELDARPGRIVIKTTTDYRIVHALIKRAFDRANWPTSTPQEQPEIEREPFD